MQNNPMIASKEEKDEIASFFVFENFGGNYTDQDFLEMRDIVEQAFIAKFHYITGSPGYYGDMFLLCFDSSCTQYYCLTRSVTGHLQLTEQEKSQ